MMQGAQTLETFELMEFPLLHADDDEAFCTG